MNIPMCAADLAHAMTEIVANATDQQAVWRKDPLTLNQVSGIRTRLLEYFEELGVRLADAEIETEQVFKL